MHCNICDKELSEKEVSWNEDINTFEPCSECLEIIYEAAYGSGFDHDDDSVSLIEEEPTTEDLIELVNGGNDD
jgi:hypothetical protein